VIAMVAPALIMAPSVQVVHAGIDLIELFHPVISLQSPWQRDLLQSGGCLAF
jgi:hypothetical protein